jgi:hypothetical protein
MTQDTNKLREWVLSRMDRQRNCIIRAINREQYLFWQARRLCEALKPQYDGRKYYSLETQKRIERVYFDVLNRACRRDKALTASAEWRAFEAFSHEHILLRKALGIRWNFKWESQQKRWTLEESIRLSRDVMTGEN